MKTNCVFTIVAKNYVGLAQLLQKSFFKHNQDSDFFIVVADELEGAEFTNNVISAHKEFGFDEDRWVDMSFKYPLTEFCTAIKPAAFKYLFSKGYNKVIYLDPDIYVFNTFKSIFNDLDKYNVILCPHVAGMHVEYKGEHVEGDILREGNYNLGFCALSMSSRVAQMLDWWDNRLIDYCFAYKGFPYCYDQKWMVLLTCYFNHDEILISRNLGYNLAPWNYFEREVYKKDGEFRVRFRNNEPEIVDYPVTFVHFAGYKYADLIKGEINRQRLSIRNYEDINELVSIYMLEFQKNAPIMERYLNLPYSYMTYEDGTRIEKMHRSIYNGLIKKGYNVGNPFKVGKGTLFSHLKKEHLFSGAEVEKLNMSNYKGLGKKEKLLDIYYRLLKTLMGYKRYLLFQKSLFIYVNPEKQDLLLEKYYKK